MGSMASTSGEDSSNTTSRYYCHKCTREVDGVGEDMICPSCNTGFLEKIEPGTSSSSFGSGSAFSSGPRPPTSVQFEFTTPGGSSNDPTAVNIGQFLQQLAIPLFGSGSPFAMGPPGQGMGGESTGAGGGQTGGQDDEGGSGQTGTGSASGTSNAQNSSGTTGGAANGGIPGQQQPFQQFLQQLYDSLTTGGGGAFQVAFQLGGEDGGMMGGQTFLAGNPGDYAWGPNSLDAIVTQLLNQVEGGSPPLAPDDVKKLTKTVVTQTDIDNRRQCPVCFDDFHLEEKIIQLHCGHGFHIDCIEPWVQRHNSCPVCRKPADGSPEPPQPPNSASATFGPMSFFGGGSNASFFSSGPNRSGGPGMNTSRAAGNSRMPSGGLFTSSGSGPSTGTRSRTAGNNASNTTNDNTATSSSNAPGTASSSGSGPSSPGSSSYRTASDSPKLDPLDEYD